MSSKVLVTGADGFIGSHLVELLIAKGYSVKALSYYNSFNNWGWLENLPDKNQVEVISGDVRDPFFCKELTKETDIIFHLAALIAIPYSYVAPHSYIDTNVKGTLNICQAALENGCKRLIHTSTSEVYGTAKYVPIDENHPLQPQSPYSASKIGADMIALSYYHSFKLPVVVARPFNTYGPRQSARAVIPTIITQVLQGNTEIHLGDTSPTRDFNYVKDTCKGFVQLASCSDIEGNVVNIGSNTEISIGELIKTIAELMSSEINVITDKSRLRPKDSEVFRLKCENALIQKLTGYTPDYSLKQGLAETINWFRQKENLSQYKANLYNV